MDDTPASLLEQLRLHPREQAWRELYDLYAPWLLGWLRSQGMQSADAEDVLQQTFTVVVGELPKFEHNRQKGAFRKWLKSILIYRARAFWKTRNAHVRATGDSDLLRALEQLEDERSSLARQWEHDHDRHVAHQVMEQIRSEFTESAWQVFQRTVVERTPAANVAEQLGMTVNAVLLAKSRILRRARAVAAGLVE